ncbi:unnamed protein product [Trichobilharzia szidati]|nr:unnamed protein product [Trichobilharzia szidati]
MLFNSRTYIAKVDHWYMAALFSFFCALFTFYFCINNRKPEKYFSELSSKTAYRFCGLKPYGEEIPNKLKQCSLVHVNALFRHGTRTPNAKSIVGFADVYNRLKRSYENGSPIPREFIEHPIPFEGSAVKELLPTGYEEHDGLGRRFRDRMIKYFNLTDENVRFYSSSIDRSIASGRAFYNGLIDGPPVKPIWNRKLYCGDAEVPDSCILDEPTDDNTIHHKNIKINDDLLRFFAKCKSYIEKIEKNKTASVEYYQFLKSEYVNTSYENFLQRYNLNREDYTSDDVRTIFLACSYEIAAMSDFGDSISPWCKLLTPSDIPVWEYSADLKHYWLKSYGYELNYIQSCPLLGEMLTQITQAVKQFASGGFDQSDVSVHRGSFWFGHAETVLPVVAALGIFNESVGHSTVHRLTADNFDERLSMLQQDPPPPTMFRTGYITPFAGNIAFMVYYCPDSEESTNEWDKFRVEVLVNEKTVAWPLASRVQPPTLEAPGDTNAPLSTVLKHFTGCMPDVYDHDAVCSLKKNP